MSLTKSLTEREVDIFGSSVPLPFFHPFFFSFQILPTKWMTMVIVSLNEQLFYLYHSRILKHSQKFTDVMLKRNLEATAAHA